MGKINIDNSLYADIIAFCEVNDIDDVESFISGALTKGFDMEKYGDSFALFFDKESSDITHVDGNIEEEVIEESVDEVVEPVIEESIEVSSEESIEVSVEEITIDDTTPKEPIYKVKSETKRVPVTIISKSPKDNYDVYD